MLRIFLNGLTSAMTTNCTVPFLKKKVYAGFTAVCNKSYNYVSIFSQTNCKNEVNYFLGLILVVVTRVIIKTNIVIELEKSTNSMVLLMVLLPWFYNPVLSTLSQMQTIPAASFWPNPNPSSFQIILPITPPNPYAPFSPIQLNSCWFQISVIFQVYSVPLTTQSPEVPPF